MRALPPGTVLQKLHFRDRIRQFRVRNGGFYDVGSGRGILSNLILKSGYHGEGFDLNPDACALNSEINSAAVELGNYQVRCEDFMKSGNLRKVDLIVISMVLEHWPEAQVADFLTIAKRLLTLHGRICIFVPGSPSHWGIEDDTAGHLRRYTFASLTQIADKAALEVCDLRGLTYPISNFFLGISNGLVRRSERHKLALSASERTFTSGSRAVFMKTEFPGWFGYLVNEVTLYPFHLLQKMARRHPASLVIYCELGLSEKI